MPWLRRHPITCYLAVTYGVTWAAWLSLALRGRVVGAGFEPIYVLGLFGPMIGAFATTAVVAGRPGVRALISRMGRVRVGMSPWAWALALPAGIAVVVWLGAQLVATFGFGYATGRDFGAFTGFPHTSPFVLWALLVLVNGYGEETGWRGFLLTRLHDRHSPFVASLYVGVVWIGWHAPAFIVNESYRAMPLAMLPMFAFAILCGSVFLGWLFQRSRSSILVVAAWHGTYNLFSGTAGAQGALAAIETIAVIAIAIGIAARQLRRRVSVFS